MYYIYVSYIYIYTYLHVYIYICPAVFLCVHFYSRLSSDFVVVLKAPVLFLWALIPLSYPQLVPRDPEVSF